jgi:hypothetical protein
MNTIRTLVAAAIAAIAASAALSSAQAQTMIGGGGKAAPSFPIVISQPGSYKLAGNLNVPAGVNGIEIAADNVTLDLNGFTVSGPGSCTYGDSVQCTETGDTKGIFDSTCLRELTVRNGTVRGFRYGIRAGGRMSDLTLMHNTFGLYSDECTQAEGSNLRLKLNNYGFFGYGIIRHSHALGNNFGFAAPYAVGHSALIESAASQNKTGVSNMRTHAVNVVNNVVNFAGPSMPF